MRVSLLAAGTWGDFQPTLLLAAELARRGHEVRVGLPPTTAEAARALGVSHVPFGADWQVFMDRTPTRSAMAGGALYETSLSVARPLEQRAATTAGEFAAACDGADVVVANYVVERHALAIGDAMKVPVVLWHLFPFRPWPREAEAQAADRPPMSTSGLMYLTRERTFRQLLRPEVIELRRRLGLPAAAPRLEQHAAALDALELQLYSRRMVVGFDEWSDRRPFAGFVLPTPEQRRLLWGRSTALAEDDPWLLRGDPPVYVGFGSIPVLTPPTVTAMLRVLRRRGHRAIFGAGSQLDLVSRMVGPDVDVRVVKGVDQAAVLPQCLVAVHHGGASTTGTAATAGVPSVVCSVTADHPFWGEQVDRLGVGAHLPLPEFDEGEFDGALDRATSTDAGARAAELGELLRSDPPGVSVAVDRMEAAIRGC